MVLLPKEKDVVLKADDPKYKRGLVVTLKDKGGYDLYYWYDDPKKVYPAEIKVDGTVVDKAGRIVHVGFHPELAGIIADHTYRSNPSHVRYLPQSYGAMRSAQQTKTLGLRQQKLVTDYTPKDDLFKNNGNKDNGNDQQFSLMSLSPYVLGLGIGAIVYLSK